MMPVQAWSSALIAVLVGFGGTIALVVQALQVLGASAPQIESAVTALCLGIATAGLLFCWRLKVPVVLAWSTPGAALLAATAPGLSWSAVVGVFVASAVMMTVTGLVPTLGRLAQRIPAAIASAMLAGVLLPFCLTLFATAADDPLLVAVVLCVFIIARLRAPLYALLLVLMADVVLAWSRGQISELPAGSLLGSLAPMAPVFDGPAIVSLAFPLFLVTLVSQNLSGLVVLRAADFHPQPGPLIAGTGLISVLMAPFGAHAINLAAITAAICTSADAHPDREQRWKVGMIYAGFYALLALFAPLLVRFFLALPIPVISVLTGIALIPSLMSAMDTMFQHKQDREAALVTFLATGSGLTLWGLGAAFWGIAAGFVMLGARQLFSKS